MSSRYQNRYGEWAGNPNGVEPDYDRCCKEVFGKRTMRGYQCSRKRGHGPDKAYCKQHAKRYEASK